jgi:hypothetical protein
VLTDVQSSVLKIVGKSKQLPPISEQTAPVKIIALSATSNGWFWCKLRPE